VSSGKECGLRNFPGIYADVSFYSTWLRNKIDDTVGGEDDTVGGEDDTVGGEADIVGGGGDRRVVPTPAPGPVKAAEGDWLVGLCPRYGMEPIVDKKVIFDKPAERAMESDGSNIRVGVGGNLVVTTGSAMVVGKSLTSFTRGTPKAPPVERNGFMNWKGGSANWEENNCANWDFYQCPTVGFTAVVNDDVTVTAQTAASGSDLYVNSRAELVISSGGSATFGGGKRGRGLASQRDLPTSHPCLPVEGKPDGWGCGTSSHHASKKVNKKNLRSHFNEITHFPTTAPTMGFDDHVDATTHGEAATFAPTKYDSMPSNTPTQFPTKVNDNEYGSFCTSTVAFPDGKYTKNVGWVGAGPGSDYCNVWKCEVGQTTFSDGIFKKQARVCSIDAHKHKGNYCSHIKCKYAKTPTSSGKVLTVDHDHKEKHGGSHTCVYSTNPHTNQSGKPAHLLDDCACLCYGDRRQDKKGFKREINDISSQFTVSDSRFVDQNHESTAHATTNFEQSGQNLNNFYSKHTNIDGEKNPEGLSRKDDFVSQYNENDHAYNGQLLAHYHRAGR